MAIFGVFIGQALFPHLVPAYSENDALKRIAADGLSPADIDVRKMTEREVIEWRNFISEATAASIEEVGGASW